MKRLLIASVVMVGGLTGCAADRMDGRSEAGRISGEFLLLLLVAVVLYLAFKSGGGPDSAIPRDAVTDEPDRRLGTGSRGASGAGPRARPRPTPRRSRS
jgi:hypothetical protein